MSSYKLPYGVQKIRSKRSKESKDGTRFALMHKGRVVKFITQEEYKKTLNKEWANESSNSL